MFLQNAHNYLHFFNSDTLFFANAVLKTVKRPFTQKIIDENEKRYVIIIFAFSEKSRMRRCRNWQTSKTKDLVLATACGFKSHPPHKKGRMYQWDILLFYLVQRWDLNKENLSTEVRWIRRGLKGAEGAGGSPILRIKIAQVTQKTLFYRSLTQFLCFFAVFWLKSESLTQFFCFQLLVKAAHHSIQNDLFKPKKPASTSSK